MQKYFVTPEQFTAEQVFITGTDVYHIITVMRLQQGAKIIVSDNNDREAIVELQDVDRTHVVGRIIEMRAFHGESAVQVTIAQSLPKGDKMEQIIQKCTELGAVQFIPFRSERTIVQYDAVKTVNRIKRWCKIAKEAAEQAQRSIIPTIDSVLMWQELLLQIPAYHRVLIAYEGEQEQMLRPLLQKIAAEQHEGSQLRIMVMIGPEGGFTAQEVQMAVQVGVRCVCLGKRILRTETAGMMACACIMYQFGEMGE